MARLFNGSTQYLVNTSVAASLPFALTCWANSDDIDVGQHAFGISGDSGGNNEFYVIGFGGGAGGDPVQAAAVGSTLVGIATTSTGYSADTWHHACAIFVSTTDRRVFIDGGSKGTDTTTVNPAVNKRSIGASNQDTGFESYFSGMIAEAAIYDLSVYPGATDSDKADAFEALVPAMAAGYSSLSFPLGLISCCSIVGRTSPEIDIVGGNDMTLVNAPTVASHPPVVYPSSQIYTPFAKGAIPMGRMYSVNNVVAGVTTAADMIEINAPADAVVVLHSAHVTQETEFGDAAAEMLDFLIHRGSTSGSAGATPTAAPLEAGDAAFGGTVETGNTTQGTEGTVLHRETAHIASGFHYVPTPEERIIVSPSGRIIIELGTAPDDSIDLRVTAVFEEIGG